MLKLNDDHGIAYKVADKAAWAVLVGLASVGLRTLINKLDNKS